MTKQHAGAGGIFWITFVVLGLAILIGVFVWMIEANHGLPHSPERPNGSLWGEPMHQISARA